MSDVQWDDDSLEISSRPLMFGDIVELDLQLSQAYAYVNTCPKEVQEFLRPVIDAAADRNCELMYLLGFDDPNELDLKKYKHMIYKK